MSSINQTLIALFFAFFGGIIPALVWLFFWNQEKRERPEPKTAIFLAFCGGMAAVFISIFLEHYFYNLDPNILFHGSFLQHILSWFQYIVPTGQTLQFILLTVVFAPIIEELLKFIAAYILVLRGSDDREPIDPMIYMITSALGFAAIENMLFILQALMCTSTTNCPTIANYWTLSAVIGDQRFIGAMLLHTVSSATIGIFLGFNLFDKKLEKAFWIIIGLISAILIHSLFNYFMIVNTNYFFVLEVIWIVVIIVLLAFEKIKRVRLEKI